MVSAEVQMYLMPALLGGKGLGKKRKAEDEPDTAADDRKKKWKENKAKAKAKGKGKGKGSGKGPRMPEAIQGGVSKDDENNPLCFAYNLGNCTTSGSRCGRGLHKCCKPGCFASDHVYIECPK